ncbi:MULTISPECIES: RrF2 family transcriptional regulator [unclassified Paenibacillus]|uniref:RrF2 family transcriptional regulator n=1 Tax=unclassified Paenibacillus TaxID=185978 RepID=UPI00036EB457|nr:MULTISPECIES: Rrf2 family transcriptional regulator [unclassified Paenibacillus]MCM3340891.1 Rrf2 family transcriptional regulator [Paenibacillus sp. MER TA 81-3]
MKKEKYTCHLHSKSFGLALQALTVISQYPNRCPSGEIAEHVQSEATLIRRILAKLAQENILETREGRDGGYRLKRAPELITCADILTALQKDESFHTSLLESTGDHPFGLCMKATFSDMMAELDQSVLAVLQKYTIADLADQSLV